MAERTAREVVTLAMSMSHQAAEGARDFYWRQAHVFSCCRWLLTQDDEDLMTRACLGTWSGSVN